MGWVMPAIVISWPGQSRIWRKRRPDTFQAALCREGIFAGWVVLPALTALLKLVYNTNHSGMGSAFPRVSPRRRISEPRGDRVANH